jgi:hypothetical protein
VYNAEGYFEKNAYNAYSLNNITAKKDPDGAVAMQFGGLRRKNSELLTDHVGLELPFLVHRHPHREPCLMPGGPPISQPIFDCGAQLILSLLAHRDVSWR